MTNDFVCQYVLFWKAKQLTWLVMNSICCSGSELESFQLNLLKAVFHFFNPSQSAASQSIPFKIKHELSGMDTLSLGILDETH